MTRLQHKIELYRDVADEWRMRIAHDNGQILFVSSESYKKLDKLERALDNLIADIRANDLPVTLIKKPSVIQLEEKDIEAIPPNRIDPGPEAA